MKIVISGGLGYVGGRLSSYFAKEGHEVIALSRQAGSLNKVVWPKGLRVLHPETFQQDTLLWKNVDAFIHLAALNENDCIKNPFQAIDVNISQPLQWLDAVYNAGIKTFVYFSTAHVYGKPLTGFYDESSLTVPVHPYAITHKCAEDYVLAYHVEKGMSNLVIRLTNSFGGPAFPTADRWTLLVNDLCRSAVTKSQMTLLSDGSQLRDFICLEDVCRAVDHLARRVSPEEKNPIYNLGSGTSMSVWDMAIMVKSIAETFLREPVELTRKEPGQPSEKYLLEIANTKLLKSGFVLRGSMEEEIKTTLLYFKENMQLT
jgi:UDP-glucose 4-epimerase